MGDYKLRKIIEKKQNGSEFTSEDIDYFVSAVKKTIQNKSDNNGDEIADRCQIGAMLMAIYLKGFSDFETNQLTLKMRDSGHVFQWPDELKNRIVDKHSTGGVGDKISLILVPALAACGLLIPMISGRSLDHTGGTLDKLEAIKHFSSSLEEKEIQDSIASIGCCIAGQTSKCIPADKVLYACRDMTATVDYPPLIISSIVSKKLSENPHAIVYDVKFGKGAIFKSKEDALETAIGLVKASRPVKAVALLTSMEGPLGRRIGDSLEVLETIDCLKGGGPKDIIELVEALGGELLRLTIGGNREKISETLKNGTALRKFHDMVINQHADPEIAKELCYGDANKALRGETPHVTNFIYSGEDGFIEAIDPLILGKVWKEEYIFSNRNPRVGFLIKKSLGDEIKQGDVWMEFHHQRDEIIPEQRILLNNAITVSNQRVQRKLIGKVIYMKDDFVMIEDY
ncbi:Thymidine phosphorylase [Araneus ventricosus]|uniref:Thymidine phosphorylase n=1 Tax=Araneus ventricosus TaxID=182803 RepID=A0A4Y2DUI3_ARAVE|nr:Thymidine phosphorylase [Araneus ventricosus]